MRKFSNPDRARLLQAGTDANAADDVDMFLRILADLSGTLRDLGYPGESRMLMGVKTDIQQRLRAAMPTPN